MTYESKCVGISQIRVPDPDRNDCRPRIRILESAYLIGWILHITGIGAITDYGGSVPRKSIGIPSFPSLGGQMNGATYADLLPGYVSWLCNHFG